jgi:hypothetical protein
MKPPDVSVCAIMCVLWRLFFLATLMVCPIAAGCAGASLAKHRDTTPSYVSLLNRETGLRRPSMWSMQRLVDPTNASACYAGFTYAAYTLHDELVVLTDVGNVNGWKAHIAAIGVIPVSGASGISTASISDLQSLVKWSQAVATKLVWFGLHKDPEWYTHKRLPEWMPVVDSDQSYDLGKAEQSESTVVIPLSELSETARTALCHGEAALMIWYANGASPGLLIPAQALDKTP